MENVPPTRKKPLVKHVPSRYLETQRKPTPVAPTPPRTDASPPAERTSPLHDLSLQSLATHAAPSSNDPAEDLRAKLEAYRQQKQAAKASATKKPAIRSNTPARAPPHTPATARVPITARAAPKTADVAPRAAPTAARRAAPAMPGVLATLAVAARRPTPLVCVQLLAHGTAVTVALQPVDAPAAAGLYGASTGTPAVAATPVQPRPGARRVSLAAPHTTAAAPSAQPVLDAALLRVQVLQWQYSHALLQRRAATSAAQADATVAAAALAVADAAHRVGQVKARLARARVDQHAAALAAQLAPCLQEWQALQANALTAVRSMTEAMEASLQAVPLVGGACFTGGDGQQVLESALGELRATASAAARMVGDAGDGPAAGVLEAATQARALLESQTRLCALLGRVGNGVDELRREAVWAASVVHQGRARCG